MGASWAAASATRSASEWAQSAAGALAWASVQAMGGAWVARRGEASGTAPAEASATRGSSRSSRRVRTTHRGTRHRPRRSTPAENRSRRPCHRRAVRTAAHQPGKPTSKWTLSASAPQRDEGSELELGIRGCPSRRGLECCRNARRNLWPTGTGRTGNSRNGNPPCLRKWF